MFDKFRSKLANALVQKTKAGVPNTVLGNTLMGVSNFNPPKRGTQELLDLYSESPWIRAVVNKIGSGVSDTTWRLFYPKDIATGRAKYDPSITRMTKKKRDARIIKDLDINAIAEITDHPLLSLLEAGNEALTGKTVMQLIAQHIDLCGEAFIVMERNAIGVPIALWPVPPAWVRRTPNAVHDFYTIHGVYGAGMSSSNIDIPKSEMIYIKDANPSNPYGRGTGVAAALSDEIEIDEYAAKHLKAFFYNRAKPDLIISGDNIGRDDTIRLEEKWLEKHQGFMNCHDDSTEVLTKDGWKLGTTLKKSDLIGTYNTNTKKLEYQNPEEIYLSDYTGEMHSWSGQKMDALVTPNHRMWFRPGNHTEWRFEESKDVLNRCHAHLLHAAEYEGTINSITIPAVVYGGTGRKAYGLDNELTYKTKDFAKILGFVISEGYVDETWFCITQGEATCDEKSEIIDAIEESINVLKVEHTSLNVDDNILQWRIFHKGLTTWLKNNIGGKAATKRLPKECFDWDVESKFELLNSLILGDGQWRKGNKNSATYWTISKQLADDIQILALSCGYRTMLTESIAKTPSGPLLNYRIGITKSPVSILQKKISSWPTKVQYSGKIWCATVPNSTMITRRNGKVLISGNSFKPLFMSRKVDIKELSQNMEQQQMVQLREQERNTIIQVFGVSPEILGIVGDSKRSTISLADMFFSKHVITPRVELIRAYLQKLLVPIFDDRLILDFDSPVAEDVDFTLEVMKAEPAAFTLNDWRALAKRETLGPKGKVVLVPVNQDIIAVSDLKDPNARQSAQVGANSGDTGSAANNNGVASKKWFDDTVAQQDAEDESKKVVDTYESLIKELNAELESGKVSKVLITKIREITKPEQIDKGQENEPTN